MTWKDKVKAGPASFNGVPFFVSSTNRAGGRKTIVHEYPKRDDPFVEDNGRKSKKFTVEGYVIGEDYLTDKDNLITALEQQGPGRLVHPFYGVKTCAVEDFSVRETKQDGGMATFSIQLIETPQEPAQPATVTDVATAAQTSAEAYQTSSKAVFLASYDPIGVYLGSASAQLTSVSNTISTALGTVQMDEQALATLSYNLNTLTQTAVAVVETPGDVVDKLEEIFAGIEDPKVALAAYYFPPGEQPPDTTPNRAQERANFDALQRLIQRLALVRNASLTLLETFESFEAALAQRETITDLLDAQADATSDDTYPDLAQLRADIVNAVPGDESDLPHLIQVTPPVTIPSLVLAYQLYGDLASEQSLIDRNGVQSPGFIMGGIALEVLSRE